LLILFSKNGILNSGCVLGVVDLYIRIIANALIGIANALVEIVVTKCSATEWGKGREDKAAEIFYV
jgi:hypothetical protein